MYLIHLNLYVRVLHVINKIYYHIINKIYYHIILHEDEITCNFNLLNC